MYHFKSLKVMRNRIIIYSTVIWLSIFNACDYLDVVPDNVATIDNAFTSRTTAEKYLFTCYSYMASHASLAAQAYMICDEFWAVYPTSNIYWSNAPFEVIARGNQNVVSPIIDYWNGLNGGKNQFQGLRDCNLFLERMNNDIPGLFEFEKIKWIAEVKFLKAYYHYWLLRMYGPIPLIKENLPVSASVEEVLVKREPVDECFDYIVSLLDEAIADLPLILENVTVEMGRATQPMAMALKAKVLVEAASPLFNGNADYSNFKRKDDVQYFNQTYDVNKWEKAAVACREAIDNCHLAGYSLYTYQPGIGETLADETITELSIRNCVTESNYIVLNKEVIWVNTNSLSSDLQVRTTPKIDPVTPLNIFRPTIAPPLAIAEMFYTARGIPIDEDQEWESSGQYNDRYKVKTATEDDKYIISSGFQTATLHFDREARFYGNLAFDGGLWFGFTKFDSNDQWVIGTKVGDSSGKQFATLYSITGYYCKKLSYYRNTYTASTYVITNYPWPVMRLADLYLLCSEAANEAYGPLHEDATQWINLVRSRAGLEDVETSWANYATVALRNKPSTQEGLRDIIQRERLIELANEGHRYWDIRRWKRAKELWHNQPIQGWDIDQADTESYYRVINLYTPQFTTKNYLWPLRESDLWVNRNLDQNPGW